MSFVIDEALPVSKWKMFGYSSPQAAAQDWNNLQPAHGCCNSMKGAKINYQFPNNVKKSSIISYSEKALEKVHEDIELFAEQEGLTAHANSIRVRFEQ